MENARFWTRRSFNSSRMQTNHWTSVPMAAKRATQRLYASHATRCRTSGARRTAHATHQHVWWIKTVCRCRNDVTTLGSCQCGNGTIYTYILFSSFSFSFFLISIRLRWMNNDYNRIITIIIIPLSCMQGNNATWQIFVHMWDIWHCYCSWHVYWNAIWVVFSIFSVYVTSSQNRCLDTKLCHDVISTATRKER